MDVRIFSRCHFTLTGLREAFSDISGLYVRSANRFNLQQQGKRNCIFVIDYSSEGAYEYYDSIKKYFSEMVYVFIVLNNSRHEPVGIDARTLLVSKTCPRSYFERLPDFIAAHQSLLFRPVRLSKSECAVFQNWITGRSVEDMSATLGINKKLVLNSRARLLKKYGVHDKNSLLLIARLLFGDIAENPQLLTP